MEIVLPIGTVLRPFTIFTHGPPCWQHTVLSNRVILHLMMMVRTGEDDDGDVVDNDAGRPIKIVVHEGSSPHNHR